MQRVGAQAVGWTKSPIQNYGEAGPMGREENQRLVPCGGTANLPAASQLVNTDDLAHGTFAIGIESGQVAALSTPTSSGSARPKALTVSS